MTLAEIRVHGINNGLGMLYLAAVVIGFLTGLLRKRR